MRLGKAPEFLRGIWAPVTTPFTYDGELSTDNLERNLNMWLISPLNGFVVLGSTGEFPMLTYDEKLAVIRSAVRAAEERPVLAGTGCNSTAETIALTQEAAAAGVQGVMVITPYYFGASITDEALEEHYTKVADASPVPVLLYNYPQNTGVDLSVEVISRLAEHDNIVGIKDSSGDLTKLDRIIAAVPPDFRVFVGAPQLLVPGLSLGAAGGILALANVVPWECVEIFRLFQDGKYNEAMALQKRLNVVADATDPYGVAGIKALLQMVGYYGGPPRSPLMPISDTQLDEIRLVLRDVRMLGC